MAQCARTHHHVIVNKAAAHAQQSFSSVIDVLASPHFAIPGTGFGPGALQLPDGGWPAGPGARRMLGNLLICCTTYHLLGLVAAWAAPVRELLAGLRLQATAGSAKASAAALTVYTSA